MELLISLTFFVFLKYSFNIIKTIINLKKIIIYEELY